MKKLLAFLLTLVLLLGMTACAGTGNNSGNGAQDGPAQNGGGQGDSNGGGSAQITPPDYAFSPYGTWVWVGNDKFTMTLNEDGSAVFQDGSDNSALGLNPMMSDLYLNGQNSFEYREDRQTIKLILKDAENNLDRSFEIKTGNGYYIISNEYEYSFVPAQYYAEAHQVFMNEPIKSTWAGEHMTQPGETVDLYSDNEVKLTLNKIEMDSNYDVKIYCTISAKIGVSSLDWIGWTLYTKGDASNRSSNPEFYDLNGKRIEGLKDGQTVEAYFTINSVDTDKNLAWFGELQAGVYISGMYMGVGCYIVLPTAPNK